MSQFIVQIVGKSLAFMFLHVDVFQRQALILGQGFSQFGIGCPAQRQLPLRLEIPPR
jgi:hypothetical protein